MDANKITAFLDEFEAITGVKTAAVQEYLGQRDFEQEKDSEGDNPEDRKYVTKKRLRQLVKMLPVAALGGGLGYATGRLVRKGLTSETMKSLTRAWRARHPTASRAIKKYGPPVLGGAAAGAGMLAAMRSKTVRKWLEKDDEGSRSK
jgi:hypothetical protein